MAGYSYIHGMSNSAIAAYRAGIKPLSQITAGDLKAAGWTETKKLAVGLAKTGFWDRSEWHHTGGTWYNECDFFDPDHLVEQWAEIDEAERADLRDQVAQAGRPAEKTDGVRVAGRFAIFGGSRRQPRYLGHVDFTGTLIGGWIQIDGGGRKRADGRNIDWAEDR